MNEFSSTRNAHTMHADRSSAKYGSNRRQWIAGTITWVAAVACSGVVASAALTYPDQAGVNVTYTSMHESSATDDLPLYGEPTIKVDSLFFEDASFAAAAGSGKPSVDVTDGAFSFTIEGNDDTTIDAISIVEGGDYTLVGTASATVQAQLAFTVTVLEVDDQPITPLLLTHTETLKFDSLPPEQVGTSWEGSALFDLSAALAAENVVGGVTKVNVDIDNILVALANSSAFATIAKKSVTVTPTVTHVPEPMGAALVAVGALMLGCRRRVSAP